MSLSDVKKNKKSLNYENVEQTMFLRFHFRNGKFRLTTIINGVPTEQRFIECSGMRNRVLGRIKIHVDKYNLIRVF